MNLVNHTLETRKVFFPMEGHHEHAAEIHWNGKFLITIIIDNSPDFKAFLNNLGKTPVITLCTEMNKSCYKPDAFDDWKEAHGITPVHKNFVESGDVIVYNNKAVTVGDNDFGRDTLTGRTIFGDSFMNGCKKRRCH